MTEDSLIMKYIGINGNRQVLMKDIGHLINTNTFTNTNTNTIANTKDHYNEIYRHKWKPPSFNERYWNKWKVCVKLLESFFLRHFMNYAPHLIHIYQTNILNLASLSLKQLTHTLTYM